MIGHQLFDVWNWWRAQKKTQRAELRAPAIKTATGPRCLEAVVAGEQPKLVEEPQSRALMVYGPGGLRLELSDEGQVKLAARLLRELGWE